MSARKVLEPIAWLLQVSTGLLMIFLVTFHFLITHTHEEALKFEEVVKRFEVYKAFYILLLLAVVFHAFNGLRAILLDTNFGVYRKRLVNSFVTIVAILALLSGLYIIYII
ncbi:MAG: succinate dehydrogenase [Archaeoglobaceae archaeon]|nr:succinate dehydrogenase [Archaeoglobaceae archaeon]MCX8151973.1 succinate dehydrogenase [Archaeoglobaceae archaeon]MDW8013362.1 succinate dehydrogenase [Archaeoglobaceae archaeon]